MTKPGSNNQLGVIKWILIVASIASSLLGARLAALGDTQAASMRLTSNQVVVQTGGKTQIEEMPAIPTAISPDMLPPVARSGSSR